MIVGALLLGLVSQAAPPEPGTRFERFVNRPGTLVLTSATTVAELHWVGGLVRVLAVKAVEADAPEQAAFALRLENPSTHERRPAEAVVFLDADELPALIAGLEKMAKLPKDWASGARERDEARLGSRGDFRFGFAQAGLKQWAFMSLGHPPKLHVTANNVETLRDLKDALEKGAAKLKDLGAK